MSGVMWQVSLVRLDRVGASAARFLDVNLDLTGIGRQPLDTILWLRNGGGKSTVLSLICALIRPHRRDFLATTATDKHLEDYVLGADTAHVAVEWSGPSGRRLVTGAVYEWTDRVQPADPNRDHDKLQARWYAFTPVPGRAELNLLPFADTDGEPTRLKDFAAAVRGWDALPGCGATVTDVQDRWAELLDDHGLDPELFSAILRMNATEGGIESQFQFRNADQFVKYLLELVVDPDTPRQVSTILEQVRAGLAERPALLADLTFADQAVPLLHRLAEARTAHAAAVAAHAEALACAAALRGELRAGAQHAADAADAAGRLAETEAERAQIERRAGDAAYNRSVELRRIAAVYAHEAAVARRDDLSGRLDVADEMREAWQAVPQLAALAAAQHRVRTLRALLEAATTEAEPLRTARDAAAGQFAAALDDAVVALDAQKAEAEESRSEQLAAAEEASNRRVILADDRGAKNARLASLVETLRALEADLTSAVSAGHLYADEEPARAVERHHAADLTARQQLADIVDRRTALRRDRAELVDADQRLRENQHQLQHARDAVAEQRTVLIDRIRELAEDERLRLLAASDEIDVLAEGSDLMALLREQILRTDRRRVELGVEGAEDDRAAAALAATGLLPPVLDVVRVLNALEDEQIAATSGWAYLADSVPRLLRSRVLAASPALAGGVLVHEPTDLDAAQGLLSSAALRPTSAVAVGTTADLQAVVQAAQEADTPESFVVPPAAALIDKTAADEELRLRELARDDRADEQANLARARSADEELHHRLGLLLSDCPPGRLDALDLELSGLDLQLTEMVGKVAALAEKRAALDVDEERLADENNAAQKVRQAAATALGALPGLVARTEVAEPQRTEVASLPAQIEGLGAAIVEAENSERRSRAAAEATRGAVDALTRTLAARRSERATLGDTAAVTTTAALDTARERWEIAEASYRGETSDSELAGRVIEAERAVDAPAAEVATLSVARRERAEGLLASPEGREPNLRVEAISAAATTAAHLREDKVAAEVGVELARAEVDQYTPADRRRRVTLDEKDVPPTREAALAAAQAAEAERDARLAAENQAQTRAQDAAARKLDSGTRAELLRSLLPLLDGDRAEPAEMMSAPFAGSIGEAQHDADKLRDRVRTTGEEVSHRLGHLQGVATDIVVWANEDRFQGVKADVRGRFRVSDAAEELGPGAIGLADDLVVYAANLRGRLDDLEEHKKVVVTAMAGMVRQALKALARAQSTSELPDTLGPWAGHRFLEVGPRSRIDTSPPVVTDRCSRLVDVLASRGAEVPRGLELLWQATSAVVGEGNWKARVLKPSTSLAIDRVSVEKMRKWSGGEKVTISLLLFCMVVKLRAANRGRDLPGLGTLPLDNPLGKANYVVFLDLQRKVAAANGVQLIFLTGVGDMKAVGRFPNIIRLRNTSHRGREYVRIAERQVAHDDPAGAVDSTRIWRDDPVLRLL